MTHPTTSPPGPPHAAPTDAEWRALELVWRVGRGTVRDYLGAHLEAGRREWAYMTLRTLLLRLVHKELVAEVGKQGRSQLFEPAVSPETMVRREVREFAQRYLARDPERLAIFRRVLGEEEGPEPDEDDLEPLSPALWEVMESCWRLGPAEASELHAEHAQNHDRAYYTVSTHLRFLAAMGYVRQSKRDDRLRFKPLVDVEEALEVLGRSFLHRLRLGEHPERRSFVADELARLEAKG